MSYELVSYGPDFPTDDEGDDFGSMIAGFDAANEIGTSSAAKKRKIGPEMDDDQPISLELGGSGPNVIGSQNGVLALTGIPETYTLDVEDDEPVMDYEALGKAIRAGFTSGRSKRYRLSIPIGSDLDKAIRPTFGSRGSQSWDQQRARSTYKYSGSGAYRRRWGVRRRALRSSGLRLGRYRRYRGRGGYFMQKLFGAKPGGFWDRAGDAVADFADSTSGGATAMIRQGARKLMGGGMYMGQGAYTQANSLVDAGAAVPGFNDVPDGNSVVISHREYISDVYGPPSGNFTNVVYNINPGLERTFPWLSQIACNYDEYTIAQLMFTYRPTVTDFAAASGQQGQVIMATQYNANDEPFTDKRVMMQYDGAMSSKVSCEQVHGVECNPKKLSGDQGKYVRNRPVLEDHDINTYDHGQFNIAIADIPNTYANQSLGELWVSYTVELRKPKFYANKGLAITKDIFVAVTQGGAKQSFAFGDINAPSDYRLFGQQNMLESALEINNQAAPDLVPAGTAQISMGSNGFPDIAPASGTQIWAYKITLPAYWAGSLEVLLNQLVDDFTAGINPCVYRLYIQGNVTPIYDVIAQNTTSAGLNATGYTFGTTATGPGAATFGPPGGNDTTTMMQRWHIRAQESSGGIDNVLYFVLQTPDAQTVDAKVASTMLTLTEYNTGFNYKVDGNNDDIILVDKNGTIATPPF
jgi:hypothetical protein